MFISDKISKKKNMDSIKHSLILFNVSVSLLEQSDTQ